MEKTRRELVEALEAVSERYPQWRFGQVVANVASWAGEDQPADVWDVSDEQMLQAARDHLRRAEAAIRS